MNMNAKRACSVEGCTKPARIPLANSYGRISLLCNRHHKQYEAQKQKLAAGAEGLPPPQGAHLERTKAEKNSVDGVSG